MGLLGGFLLAWFLHAGFAQGARALGPVLTPEEMGCLLGSIHSDYRLYIGKIRYGATRLRPGSLYAGLVRQGGIDPRRLDDGPSSGHGAINDLIIYADTFEPWRTPAWRRLLADHEYFHARHLARGFDLPLVAFGDRAVDLHFHEALAWGYVARRADRGLYGELSRRERVELAARYREHLEGFRRFVMKHQPSAWAYYGKMLEAPGAPLRSADSGPAEVPEPAAGPETN
ncbi:MAG: hypothetical protein ACE5HU_07930 [Acidobacteriota bacterium]